MANNNCASVLGFLGTLGGIAGFGGGAVGGYFIGSKGFDDATTMLVALILGMIGALVGTMLSVGAGVAVTKCVPGLDEDSAVTPSVGQ